ncbi:cell adhesion molecule 3-like [Anneissia japonica]|uniref:cell adhesion molecule 3-like n=1 Tax=Anneissia japonica TaxID=1529436 RepID=UPI0014257DCF|nr:cell adhesion molecule 3-like [Anneissia japonica]
MIFLQSDFVLFTFLCVVSLLAVADGTFTTNPNEQVTKEGGSAYFFCIFEEDLGDGMELAWLRSGIRISNIYNEVIPNVVDDPSRYTIESAENRYGLSIRHIKRSDATEYACAVYNSNIETKKAEAAVLIVNEIPQKPVCLIVDDSYTEGTEATIKCRVENTNPPATVKWKIGNEILNTDEMEETGKSEWKYYTYKFWPSYNDNRATYTCQVTTEADENFVDNCTTGAINVLYKPRVNIQESATINEGQEAVIFCEADANPEALTYSWTFEPQIPEDKIRLENNNKILRILNPTKNLNQTKVICTSRNKVGYASAYVNLVIRSPQLKTYNTGSVYDPALSDNQVNEDQGLAFTVPLILALAGGCSVLFLFLLLIPICYIHMFGRKSVMTPDGRIIAQPDIYFEPRDRIMPPLPGLPDGLTWVRSVGVQVPGEAESESSFYAEISGSRKSACSAYGSYTGYGTYGRRSTYI